MFRIRELREQKNVTQEWLAKQVGITRIYLSKIENGRATPSTPLLKRIAGVFSVKIGDLFD